MRGRKSKNDRNKRKATKGKAKETKEIWEEVYVKGREKNHDVVVK